MGGGNAVDCNEPLECGEKHPSRKDVTLCFGGYHHPSKGIPHWGEVKGTNERVSWPLVPSPVAKKHRVRVKLVTEHEVEIEVEIAASEPDGDPTDLTREDRLRAVNEARAAQRTEYFEWEISEVTEIT